MAQKEEIIPVGNNVCVDLSCQISCQEPDIPLGDPEDLLPAHKTSQEGYKKHVEIMKRFAQENNVHFFEYKKITAPPPFPSTYPDVLDSISGHYGAFFFPIPGYTYSPIEEPKPVEPKPVVQEPVNLLKGPPGIPSPRRYPAGKKHQPIMQHQGRNTGWWIETPSRPIQQVHPFSHFSTGYPPIPPIFYTCGNSPYVSQEQWH